MNNGAFREAKDLFRSSAVDQSCHFQTWLHLFTAKAPLRQRKGKDSLAHAHGFPSLLHTLSMKTDFTLLVNMLLPKDVDQPTFNVNVCDPHFVATFCHLV